MIKSPRANFRRLRILRLVARITYVWVYQGSFGFIGLFLLCVPAKSVGQDAGVGIFSDLAIHDGTFSVWGTLVLDRAQVHGTLTMADRKPQRIMARLSRVEHLYVSNLTCVTLHGDLTIYGELRIVRGIFDARFAALILGDSVRRVIAPEGRILLQSHSPQLGSVCGNHSRLSHAVPLAVLVPETRCLGYREPRPGMITSPGGDVLSVIQIPDEPPPESFPLTRMRLWTQYAPQCKF